MRAMGLQRMASLTSEVPSKLHAYTKQQALVIYGEAPQYHVPAKQFT